MTRASIGQLRDQLLETCRSLHRQVSFMEVCGTHTVSIFRSGLRSLLPGNLRLISGPGCPVCVTPQRYIDAAIDLAARDGVMVATYGDMLRVPGREGSLEQQRARGGTVKIVYSIRDALTLAERHPGQEVVFIGVGFETTAPATAAAILEARQRGLSNFSVLLAHKLVIPAMLALLADPDVPLDGFLCPGHVSVIIGTEAYRPIVADHRKPCTVAGFEPAQIIAGLTNLVGQVLSDEARLENVYQVAVTPEGNRPAQALIDQVFEPADSVWRAMGEIPRSGLEVRPGFAPFDALQRFNLPLGEDDDPAGCLCGEVIQGKAVPAECGLFGDRCTPTNPVGPCMVSSEGTCAAWFKYGRQVG